MKGQAGIVALALVFITGFLVIPLVIGLYYRVSPLEILGLVASAFILQPVSVVVGLGLGIDPVPVLLILCSFGVSVIIVLFGICDLFADRSDWLRRQITNIETITQRSGLVKKYGIYTLIPFIWVPGIGLYGCVLIAWLFGWRGVKSGMIIFSGWVFATVLVLLGSLGILEIIF